MTSYGDRWLGDPSFDPVMQELERRAAVVYVHPGSPACCSQLMSYVPPFLTEFTQDTNRTITSLMFSGQLVRRRKIRFIFSHAGGTMPFLIERFVRLGPQPKVQPNLPFGNMEAALKSFHYDIAQSSHPIPLGALVKLVTTSQIVFGTGNPRARLIFVGEGPGQEEDRQGIPFVGPAGALLTDIIEKGMKLARSEVYICNVVKCRPPDNRNPEPDEVEACAPFLARQIELVSPEVLVTLGNFATKFVLNTQQGITRMRGRAYPWHGRTVVPTFHPAAILHGGGERSRQYGDLVEDFELIRDTLAGLGRPPEPVALPDAESDSGIEVEDQLQLF